MAHKPATDNGANSYPDKFPTFTNELEAILAFARMPYTEDEAYALEQVMCIACETNYYLIVPDGAYGFVKMGDSYESAYYNLTPEQRRLITHHVCETCPDGDYDDRTRIY